MNDLTPEQQASLEEFMALPEHERIKRLKQRMDENAANSTIAFNPPDDGFKEGDPVTVTYSDGRETKMLEGIITDVSKKIPEEVDHKVPMVGSLPVIGYRRVAKYKGRRVDEDRPSQKLRAEERDQIIDLHMAGYTNRDIQNSLGLKNGGRISKIVTEFKMLSKHFKNKRLGVA